jgi:hypothetical protein
MRKTDAAGSLLDKPAAENGAIFQESLLQGL